MEKKDVKILTNDVTQDIRVIKIEGVLDTLTSPSADEIIAPLVNENKNIIIDSSGLTYINSTGLALILKYYIQMRRRNHNLKIANLNKIIYEIMDISGALKLLDVYKTLDEAIESSR